MGNWCLCVYVFIQVTAELATNFIPLSITDVTVWCRLPRRQSWVHRVWAHRQFDVGVTLWRQRAASVASGGGGRSEDRHRTAADHQPREYWKHFITRAATDPKNWIRATAGSDLDPYPDSDPRLTNAIFFPLVNKYTKMNHINLLVCGKTVQMDMF